MFEICNSSFHLLGANGKPTRDGPKIDLIFDTYIDRDLLVKQKLVPLAGFLEHEHS